MAARLFRTVDGARHWHCAKCERFLPESAYYMQPRRGSLEPHSWCKQCYCGWRAVRREKRRPSPPAHGGFPLLQLTFHSLPVPVGIAPLIGARL